MRTRGQRLADLRDDARDLLDRAGAAGDVGTPLPRQQQVAAAEHVERQIAVGVVVAVEEAAFLTAVQRDVGVVEIEHDLSRRALMRLEEKIDQQRVDPRPVAVDLVVLRAWRRGVCSRRFSVLLPATPRSPTAGSAQLARQHRKGRVLAQLVVIVQVLVAQRQAEDPLPTSVSSGCSTKRGSRRSVKHAANRRISPRPRSTWPSSSAPAFDVMSPPSKPATTARRSTASNSNSVAYTLSASGRSWDHREIVAAQQLSQILSPDAPSCLRNPG